MRENLKRAHFRGEFGDKQAAQTTFKLDFKYPKGFNPYQSAHNRQREMMKLPQLRPRPAAMPPQLAVFLVLGMVTVAAADRIELEVLALPGSAPTAAHDWMEVLKKLEVDRMRFRQDVRSAQPTIEVEHDGSEAVYKITAVISNNRLVVPGDRFSKYEVGKLSDWLEQLPTHAAGDPQHAFGLSADQLVYLHSQLKAPVLEETKGITVRELVHRLSQRLPFEMRTIGKLPDEPIHESLTNIASGSALAAALRPVGYVLVPVGTGSRRTDVHLELRPVRSAEESWPVGWPSTLNVKKLVPKMLDFLEVEINDVPLTEALTAMQARLEIPFLFDHNGMARHDIDPHTAKVSFPAKRTFYKKIISNLLFQAKLKSELRVDEAGNPLLWISPLKQ